MPAQVYFIDTSVFCNILPVPGRDQDRSEVLAELQERQAVSTLILPITTIVETGNFIAQLPTGGERRAAAARFMQVLRLICEGKAPWSLHQFAWDLDIVQDLIDGAGTGRALHEHAEAKVGAGDLTVLAEMRAYSTRASPATVAVWSLDADLSAFGSLA